MNEMKKVAPKKVARKIRQLAKEGKVEFAGDVTKIKLRDPDFTITNVKLHCAGKNRHSDGSFLVQWETVSAGFGTTTFYIKKGKVHCDNETMSRNFLKTVLNKLVDDAILDS